MKKILLASLCALTFTACIDEDFDLFDVDFGEVGIGGETSDFRMPLANITVRTSALTSGERSLLDVFEEADTWLPTVLPDGGEAVDLRLLTSDGGSYRTTLIRATLDEAAVDASKLNGIASLVERRYASAFDHIVPAGTSVAEFIAGNYADAVYGPVIRSSVEGLANDYLAGLSASLDTVECEIGRIDIDSDVFDMLTDGLGTPDEPHATNLLSMYGRVESLIPVDCRSDVSFVGTDVVLALDARYSQTTEIAETRLFAQSLRTIFDNARLSVPVELERYYKGRAFPGEGQAAITIRLSLHKHGGMSL